MNSMDISKRIITICKIDSWTDRVREREKKKKEREKREKEREENERKKERGGERERDTGGRRRGQEKYYEEVR